MLMNVCTVLTNAIVMLLTDFGRALWDNTINDPWPTMHKYFYTKHRS
jgi:hypothetical protein